MLWRKDELAPLFGVEAEANGVSIDTRTIESGDLFFGIVGENGVNGMDYADAAKGKGAVAVIEGLDNLRKLGQAARERNQATRIAVTGSVGKTTTKEFLATCFAALGNTHAAVASYNNHIGVPLTLSRMPRETEFGVFEIGMNHRGEIEPLTMQVRPHIAIISTIAPVHLEYMESLENIADEKSDIAKGLMPGGVMLLPADTPLLPRLKNNVKEHRIVTFGLAENADIKIVTLDARAEGTAFDVVIEGKAYSVFLPGMGVHVATNAAAALGAVHLTGGDVARAAEALSHFKPMAGRGARYDVGAFHIMDESYNASPVSVKATLRALAAAPCKGRRVAILGDMRELGPEGPALHAGLAEACDGIDTILTCGPLMKNLQDALPTTQQGGHFPDSENLAENVKNLLQPEDCVLIKGSLGMKMKKIIEAIRTSP